MISPVDINDKEEFYEDEILVRRVYRGITGNLVMVYGIGIMEGIKEYKGVEMVIYADLNAGEIKIRPKSTWFEKHPNTGVPRYVLGDVVEGKTL